MRTGFHMPPRYVAFGVCAVPAGWIADKWSRKGTMILFFLGHRIEFCPCLIRADTGSDEHRASCHRRVRIHLSSRGHLLVVEGRKTVGIPLAVIGVFGNLGLPVLLSSRVI